MTTAQQIGTGMGKGRYKAATAELIRDPESGVAISRQGRDRGPPERAQHDRIEIEGDTEPHGKVASPLDRYRNRKELDPNPERNQALYEAGIRLRTDFYLAGLSPRVTADLTSAGRGTNGPALLNPADSQIAARRRYHAAALAIDSDLWSCLREVCCMDSTAAQWADSRGWKRTADGMVALRLGLAALARHYGLLRH